MIGSVVADPGDTPRSSFPPTWTDCVYLDDRMPFSPSPVVHVSANPPLLAVVDGPWTNALASNRSAWFSLPSESHPRLLANRTMCSHR